MTEKRNAGFRFWGKNGKKENAMNCFVRRGKEDRGGFNDEDAKGERCVGA